MWVNSIAVVCFYFVYAQHADVSVCVCVYCSEYLVSNLTKQLQTNKLLILNAFFATNAFNE